MWGGSLHNMISVEHVYSFQANKLCQIMDFTLILVIILEYFMDKNRCLFILAKGYCLIPWLYNASNVTN